MKLIALLVSICQGMSSLKEGYDNLQWNKKLEESPLTIIPRVSPLDCAEECISRTGCLSFNYLKSAIFCELNYASDLSEGETLTDSPGWIYGRREHWSMLITDRCLKSSCSLVEKCVEFLDDNVCTLSQCHPSVNLPPNVKLLKSNISLDFGSTHRVACADGFLPYGGKEDVECLWDASWTTVNLECKKLCTGISKTYQNREYCFMTDRLPWSLAKEQCSLLGAHLLEVETAEENYWIGQQLTSMEVGLWNIDKWWTGGTDEGQEGIWKWTFSGRDFKFHAWSSGEPNGGNCLSIVLNRMWQDHPCLNSYAFICESELEPGN